MLLVALVFVAWSNAWHAPFELDDESSVVENRSLRDFGSFAWLKPPSGRGETVGGRPVLNATLAVNYAIGGLDPLGYHVGNVLIHALAALTLFGVVRRASRRAATAPISDWVAFLIAALWAVHPVQTAAVTYVSQRAESLMSLLYVFTLYAFLRADARSGAGPEGEGDRRAAAVRRAWYALSVSACALGMATKENMVSAPLAVLLFERALSAGGLRAAWQRRRGYYAALFGTWLVLAAGLVSTGGNRGGTIGLGVAANGWSYVLTQFPAAVHYLRLCFWPHPLVFEYGPFAVAGVSDVLVPIVLVLALLGAAVYALFRRPLLGAIACVALGVMAPTSLVPGTLQMIVEHRLYLPLASVVTLIVLGLHRGLAPRYGRLLSVVASAVIVAFCGLTLARNRVYASELRLWQDTAAKRPGNPRAQNNLGVALRRAGQLDAAADAFRRAIALQPNHAYAHANLGNILLARHEWAGAAQELQAAVGYEPDNADFHVNLAVALAQLRDDPAAIEQYRAALRLEPAATDAQLGLARVLRATHRNDEARQVLDAALRTAPASAELHLEHALSLQDGAAPAAAAAELRQALALQPGLADAWVALGNLQAQQGDASGAASAYTRALQADPENAEAHFGYGNILAQAEQLDRAAAEFRAAVALDPNYVEALNNLANCELALGQFAAAIGHYREVQAKRPGDPAIAQNLAIAEHLLHAR